MSEGDSGEAYSEKCHMRTDIMSDFMSDAVSCSVYGCLQLINELSKSSISQIKRLSFK